MSDSNDPIDTQSNEQPSQIHGDSIAVDKIERSGAVAIGRGATAIYQGLSYEEVVALFSELKDEDQPIVWDGRIPYLGLKALQESDAEFFFGREELVDDLLERVEENNFIVIAGPSGSGKSSVARAGLFHALREGRLEGSEKWLLATMYPKNDPIEQLALSMARLSGNPSGSDYIREQGVGNPNALHEQAEALLGDDRNQRLVLLVDQFEEVFTETKDEEMREAFIKLLTTAVGSEDGRVIILLSLRSDFVSNCALFPELRAQINKQNQFQLVGAMEPRDLAKAITLPSLEVGAKIEPALVKQIIDDMKGEPGALPLMSFALRDLFLAEKTSKGQPMDLTLQEYVDRGGIDEALERHADKVFETFTDEQKELAKGIFSKLITVGEGRLDTRRTAHFEELKPADTDAAAVATVVGMLSAEGVRLVTTSGVESNDELRAEEMGAAQATVTIAHEKLIDAWPWLRQLINENRELIALQNEINRDAREWAVEEDPGYLYRGGRLPNVEENLVALQPHLDAHSQRFIQASIAQREAEAKAEEERIRQQEALRQEQVNAGRFRRQRGWLGVAAVVAVIATIVALFFMAQSQEAEERAKQARDAATVSENYNAMRVHEARQETTLVRLLAVEIARFHSGSTSTANEHKDIFWQSSGFSKVQCELAERNLSVEEWEQFFPEADYRCTCQQWPAGQGAPPAAQGCVE